MIFWATLAVVSSIWAQSGPVDVGSVLLAGLTIVSLVQVLRLEQRGRVHQ